MPERIRESRNQYVGALKVADAAWDAGHYDLTDMEAYLAKLAAQQAQNANGF